MTSDEGPRYPNEPKGFRMFWNKARSVAESPEQAARILDLAYAKAEKNKDRLDQARTDFKSLLRMIRAYINGSYRKTPWSSIVTGLAAIIYFVNPLDLVPDFIIGAGLMDDATVIAFCLNAIRKDIMAFVASESKETEGVGTAGENPPK